MNQEWPQGTCCYCAHVHYADDGKYICLKLPAKPAVIIDQGPTAVYTGRCSEWEGNCLYSKYYGLSGSIASNVKANKGEQK